MVLRKKILSEFKKYAQKGRGKAFLIFRENRHIDFTKEIITRNEKTEFSKR